MQLPDTTLEDMLLRLGPSERQVYALKSVTNDGWDTVLAWKPAATFVPPHGPTDKMLSDLEAFVAQEQTKQRLLIGYLSYDFGCMLHQVSPIKGEDVGLPLIQVASFDGWLSFDTRGAVVHGSQEFTDEVQRIIKRPSRQLPTQAYRHAAPAPTQTAGAYGKAYRRVRDYIVAGDVYQVNISQQLEGTTDAGGRDLFCLLSAASQSDFQAYIEGQDFEILSYSPERFIRVQDGSITTMPIKGTRPRGATAAEDKALRKELLQSPKEQAELNMITDLMRNDLGAICQAGSVQVAQKRVLTAYPTLWHAHSTIEGRLRPDISPIGALAGVLPGGSITGCPKKRAMEIIAELEPQQRGIYTGSIFTIKPGGELDSSIVIRTMVKCRDRLYLPVGGGIVYDSTETGEYRELLDKAASFLT